MAFLETLRCPARLRRSFSGPSEAAAWDFPESFTVTSLGVEDSNPDSPALFLLFVIAPASLLSELGSGTGLRGLAIGSGWFAPDLAPTQELLKTLAGLVPCHREARWTAANRASSAGSIQAVFRECHKIAEDRLGRKDFDLRPPRPEADFAFY